MEPSGKRFLLALDVSGSMCARILGSSVLSARTASAAMAMVTARTEANYHLMAFSQTFVPLAISAKSSLLDVCNVTERVCVHLTTTRVCTFILMQYLYLCNTYTYAMAISLHVHAQS